MKPIVNIILLSFLLMGLNSCVNYYAAWQIKNSYSKENTGLDTLININGFYYYECYPDINIDGHNFKDYNPDFCNPRLFNINGGFLTIGVRFHSLVDISELFDSRQPKANGHYIITNDTIIARDVFEYQLTCYDLYESYFKIIDKNTIQLVKAITYIDKKRSVNYYDRIYKFQPYEEIWK
jgi:hypothetical protein